MNKFEKEIRNKLENYNAPVSSGAWEEFISKTHKPTSWGYKHWVISSITVAVISIVAFVVIDSINNKTISEEKQQNKQENINLRSENEKLIINSNDSIPSENSNSTDNNNTTTFVENNNTSNLQKNNTESTNYTVNKITESDFEEDNNIEDNTSINSQESGSEENNLADKLSFDIESIRSNINIINQCVPGLVEFEVENLSKNMKAVWNFGDNKQSNGKNISHTYEKHGLYEPTLTIYDQNDKVVKTRSFEIIEIFNTPVSDFSFDINNNFYTFNSFSEQEVLHKWELDGIIETERSFEYEFTKDGRFTVKHTVINNQGCKSTSSKIIDIEIEHNYFVPTAFRPLSNGINAEFGPIGDCLEDYTIRMLIFDRTGKLVFETDRLDNLWNGKINNIGEMAEPGIYLWEIITIDKYGNSKVRKGQVNLIGN